MEYAHPAYSQNELAPENKKRDFIKVPFLFSFKLLINRIICSPMRNRTST